MQTPSSPLHIGCCVTPHGLGHAARACAVMEALACRISKCIPVHYTIVSTAPAWFFAESLTASYEIYPLQTDVGLVQHDALHEDLDQTVQQLQAFYPLRAELLDQLAALFADCQLVLCDIAPVGIAAAAQARKRYGSPVRSVLLENFTWDWIYQSYLASHPEFAGIISYLEELYSQADYHIQAEPVCASDAVDLLAPPIARAARVGEQGRVAVRKQLGLQEEQQVVLVTMGGIAGTELPLAQMKACRDFCFVLPGQGGKEVKVDGNLFFFPSYSAIRHPDLIAACDAVIGKVGYSTLAEVYQAGIPFAYISRDGFRESRPLADFIAREIPSLPLSEEAFRQQDLSEMLTRLCLLPRRESSTESGAEVVAAFLQGLLSV
ncbi:MAG: hypothetical protein Q3M24_16560 [Candidatus Electrothrix aestuarii]|uniref:Glycosyl transferase family 28 C-terminal domain-containing protein n=1 Tax=Candidatus Electrothrix aestuarii TaxID=3062594 RepID=A0AAU8LS87_9BACT|nr:hypothetical protein [Candidatus Electrothrix aestuarii]